MAKNKNIRVDINFANEIERIKRRINNNIELSLNIKFPDKKKPITNPLVTRMILKQIKPNKLLKQIEIDLKRRRIRI